MVSTQLYGPVMHARSHRRKLLLFVTAVILPCLVLVGLGVRMIRQERELAEKRRSEEASRLATELGNRLLVRLERIKLGEAGAWARVEPGQLHARPENPAVVLVAAVAEDRIELPWEPLTGQSGRLQEAAFARRIQEAEQVEFAERRLARAAALYEAARRQARHPIQQAYARLLLARVLSTSGRLDEAYQHYRVLLGLSSEISDELGIPIAYYAAGQLLKQEASLEVVLERIQAEWGARRWINRAAAYMLREFTETLAETLHGDTLQHLAATTRQRARDYVALLEQAVALQHDFSALTLRARLGGEREAAASLWMLYGDDRWLVSTAPALATQEALVIAVRAGDLFDALVKETASEGTAPGEPLFFMGPGKGEALGENFPELKVTFTVDDERALDTQGTMQRAFYLATLLLVLSVTFFGAYLLWRDMRREARLAELRSQFVSSVSHELKTPLTAIRMFAETLMMGRYRDPETQRQYLETIVHESERLSRLINNVLDFSKIEQDRKRYHPERTALADVVHAAAGAMAYPLQQQGFALNVEVEEDLPEVSVDRDAIEQAILNLLANAVKYSGDARAIDLRLRRQNGQALIEVTDHGMGIPRSEHARIFEKFYRVSSPENERVPGAGLGLALVAHIADAHGGRAEVQSEPGQGSTFTLHLPLEDEA